MIQTLNFSVKQYKMVDWGGEDVMAVLENDSFQQSALTKKRHVGITSDWGPSLIIPPYLESLG
jgi:hypothetical protein